MSTTNNAINANAFTPLLAINGGTGVSNSFTMTVGGNLVTAASFTTSGANPLTLTTTGTTNATLPSGTVTLVALPGSASITTLGTVTTGTWNATVIGAAYGGTGVASPTAHGVLIAEGSSPATSVVLGAGQVLIGTTATDPAAATLTAGTGISISSVSGSITVSSTAVGVGYLEVTTTSQAMSPNFEYVANNAALVTLTLPVSASAGTLIIVDGKGAGGWKIAQNASQQIHFGNLSTTAGVGGFLASTSQYDMVQLTCITANIEWIVQGPVGNITVN